MLASAAARVACAAAGAAPGNFVCARREAVSGLASRPEIAAVSEADGPVGDCAADAGFAANTAAAMAPDATVVRRMVRSMSQPTIP